MSETVKSRSRGRFRHGALPGTLVVAAGALRLSQGNGQKRMDHRKMTPIHKTGSRRG